MQNKALMPQGDPEVQRLHEEGRKLHEYAQSRVIASDADQKDAGNDLVLIKTLTKAMEARRVFFVKPLNDEVTEINAAFKGLMAPVKEADAITNQKMLAYINERKAKREAEEEVNRLRMEAARLEMESKGELTEEVGLVEVSAAPPKTVHADVGDIGRRINTRWKCVDFSQVPDMYKQLDGPAIGKVIKSGGQIPGIEPVVDESLVVRPVKPRPVDIAGSIDKAKELEERAISRSEQEQLPF